MLSKSKCYVGYDDDEPLIFGPQAFPSFPELFPCKNLQVETQWVGHSVAQILLYEIELFSFFTLRGHFAVDC